MFLMLLALLIAGPLVTRCTTTEITLPVGVTVGLNPRYHPILSLYQSQDKYGAYVYGYATPTSTKSEFTANGVTQGGYSYIDSNGQLQTVEYTADPIHGFRVAATNLPKELPDVAAARAHHLAEYEAIKAKNSRIAALATVAYTNPIVVPANFVPSIPFVQQIPVPVTDLPEVVKARHEHLAILNAAYANTPVIPQPVQDLPEVIKARAEHLATVEQEKLRHFSVSEEINLSPIPLVTHGSVVPLRTELNTYVTPSHFATHGEDFFYNPVVPRHENQEHLRKYSYGYVGPHSAHSESRSEDGVTRGGYSYIDANGILQTVHYIADTNGFRVAASNIPVDPAHVKATS